MLRRQLIDMTPEDVKGHLERLRARRNGQGKLLTDEMEVRRKHAEGKMGKVGEYKTVEYELNRAPRLAAHRATAPKSWTRPHGRLADNSRARLLECSLLLLLTPCPRACRLAVRSHHRAQV